MESMNTRRLILPNSSSLDFSFVRLQFKMMESITSVESMIKEERRVEAC